MADTHDKRSKVLALVFTDLADSTALKTRQGDSAIETLISRHAGHVKRISAECSGRIIKWAGDGCFLTFDASSSAVLFALRLEMVHAEEPDLPGVRIGIHMGEVTENTDENGMPDIAGLAADIASRICGLAGPGQILMSAAVYDSARQRISVESLGQPILWQAHGTYTVKGFDKEIEIGEAGMKDIAPLTAPASGDKAKLVRRAKQPAGQPKPARSASQGGRRLLPLALGGILVLALVGVLAYFAGQSGSGTKSLAPAPAPVADAGPITSLAVLPLDNLMNDPEQDYFVDGMTEAVTGELSKIRALKVISRTSVMQYKDTIKTAPVIAKELGVQGLIEGSVMRDGNQVRITVQLIDARADAHLWAGSYDNTLENVFALQSDVALAIAGEIRAAITPDERKRIAAAEVIDPEAYDLYLRGHEFYATGSLQDTFRGITYFEQALKIAPDFGLAWSDKALAHWNAASLSGAYTEQIPLAEEAADKAIALAPDVGESYVGKIAIEAWMKFDWQAAKAAAIRALELSPNSADVNFWSGQLEVCVGHYEDARRLLQRADELNPDSNFLNFVVPVCLTFMGEADSALEILDRAIARDPESQIFYIIQFGALVQKDRIDEAINVAAHIETLPGGEINGRLLRSVGLTLSGRSEEARAIEQELITRDTLASVGPELVGYCLTVMGDIERALDYFERAMEMRRATAIVIFRAGPFNRGPQSVGFKKLIEDDRYWKLIDKMNFPAFPADHPGYAAEQAWFAKKKAAADANAPINKIAVLPFKNISGDPQQEFFVDGMTEALISELAKIKSIKVISRTSAMHFKNSDKKLSDIAAELGVDGVVEGSAMKAGNEVRITAQLIRAATDDHLWAESYTETLENVLKVQAQVALAIAGEIKAVVTPDERGRVNAAKTVNVAAYELYVQARHFWSLRSREGLRRARELFTMSLEIEPNFALGHVGLADTYFTLADNYLLPSAETVRLGREEAEKALALDPALGEAYATLAMIDMAQNWDWKRAEEACLKAIELSPNYATAHHWYGVYLSAAGRPSQAVEEGRQAYLLDPVSPAVATSHAQFLSRDGQIQESVDLIERVAGRHPHNARVLMVLARVYGFAGRHENALAAAERMIVAEGNKVTAAMYKAVALAHLGRPDEARRLIEDTVSGADVPTIPAVYVARAYAALDDRDRAFEWLTKACNTHDPFAWRLKFFPEFDALEGDPRYQALLRRMNFPE